MGIGIRPLLAAKQVPYALTTPHGDRDPPVRRPASVLSSAISLPLMGIGIVGIGAGLVVQRLYLTTPHGDRDLHLCAGRQAGVPGSLPLMGIGIRRHRQCRAHLPTSHYPSWGSGSAISTWRTWRRATSHCKRVVNPGAYGAGGEARHGDPRANFGSHPPPASESHLTGI